MALLKVTLNGGWRLHAYRLSEDLEEEYPGRVFFSEFKLPPPTLCVLLHTFHSFENFMQQDFCLR